MNALGNISFQHSNVPYQDMSDAYLCKPGCCPQEMFEAKEKDINFQKACSVITYMAVREGFEKYPWNRINC